MYQGQNPLEKYIQGAPRQPTGNPLDRYIAPQLPFDEEVEEDNIPDWVRYIGRAFKNPGPSEGGPAGTYKRIGQAGYEAVRDLGGGIADIVHGGMGRVAANLSGGDPLSMLRHWKDDPVGTMGEFFTGLGHMAVINPVNIMTNTKKVGDQAVPMTSEEQKQAFKDLAGNIVAVAGSEVGLGLLTKATATTKMGRVGNSLMKGYASAVPAVAAGEAIKGNDPTAAAINAMTDPLSLALTGLNAWRSNKVAKVEEIDLRNKRLQEEVQKAEDIKLAKSLESTSNTSTKEILGRLGSLTKSEDLLEAAINGHLSTDGISKFNDITSETAAEIYKRYFYASPDQLPNDIVANTELINARVKSGKVDLNFDSSWDKLAFLATRSPKKWMQVAMEHSKLPEAIVKAHGKKVGDAAKGSQVFLPTPAQQEAAVLSARTTGSQLLKAQSAGNVFKSASGEQWVIDGQIAGSITNPAKRYPLDSPELHRELGQTASELKGPSPYSNVGKQDFSPNYDGDIVPKFIYTGPNDSVMLTTELLDQKAIDSFRQTGFLVGEKAEYNGKSVLVRGAKNGKVLVNTSKGAKYIDPSELSQIPSQSLAGTKTAVSSPTRQEFFNQKIDSFVQGLDKAESFDSYLNEFLKTNKIDIADKNVFTELAYNKMNEWALATLDADERMMYETQKLRMEKDYDSRVGNTVDGVFTIVNNRGYSLDPVESGYRLKNDKGQVLATFGDFDGVKQFLRKDAAELGISLDGSIIPTTALEWTTSPPAFAPRPNKVANTYARFGNWLRPIRHVLESFDDNTLKSGIGTELSQTVDFALNKEQQFKNTTAKPLIETTDLATRLTEKVPEAEQQLITNVLNAVDVADLIKEMKPQQLQTLNQLHAEIAQAGGLDIVKQIMKANRSGNPVTAAVELFPVANNPKAIEVATKMDQLFKTKFVDPLIGLRYLSALDAPEAMLGPVELMGKYQKSGNWGVAHDAAYRAQRKAYNDAIPTFGIDKPINWYAPLIERYGGAISSEWFSDKNQFRFINELDRVGVTPESLALKDPNDLLHKYMAAGMRKASGAADLLNTAQDLGAQWLELVKTQHPQAYPQLSLSLQKWFDNIRGKPENIGYVEGLDKFGNSLKESFNIDKGINHALDYSALAMLGFKPVMLARDIANAHTQIAQNYGFQFLKDALYKRAWNDAEIVDLSKKGILPSLEADQFLSRETEMGNKWLKAAIDKGLTVSGQRFAYRKIAGGVYLATDDLVKKHYTNLLDKKIDRAEFIKRMGDPLASNSISVQQAFMKYIDNDRVDDAGRVLALSNAYNVAGRFGKLHNPLAWQSSKGRVLGQMGSWAANATSSSARAFSQGNWKRALGMAAKGAAVNTAIYGLLSSAGFDPAKMILTPWSSIPSVGPLANIFSETSNLSNSVMFSNDEQRSEFAWERIKKLTAGIIEPDVIYNIREGYKVWEEIGNGLYAAARAAGFQLDRDEW